MTTGPHAQAPVRSAGRARSADRTRDQVAVDDGASTDLLAGRVARLFFEQQLTKVDISTRLGISRFRIARLIERALREGIVRIEFRDRPAQERTLGHAIEERFGIDRCVVAAASQDAVGAAAHLCADLVDGLLADGDVIGIAWGSTIARVVSLMPSRRGGRIDVVQLAGNSAAMDEGTAAGDLTRAFAQRVGGRAHVLHAPTFVESPSLRAALADEPEIAAAINLFDELSLALVGIGSLTSTAAVSDLDDPAGVDLDLNSSLVRSGALKAPDIGRLVAAGAVGDLLVHGFDTTGRFVVPELGARAMAIGVEQLRRVPSVIAVAAGEAKAPAISAALRTGVIRILVTDAEAAVHLLAQAGT